MMLVRQLASGKMLPTCGRVGAQPTLLVIAVLFCAPRPVVAQGFPSDSGVLNVRAFGAHGDGVHDDTGAIQAAIDAARLHTRFFWPTRIVYLPAGRYLVTATLRSADTSGHYQAQMALIGESADRTTIVLADHSPGFSDVTNPKAVVFTSSGLRAGSPTDGGKRYLESGEGNDAYANFVESMTIDVGSDNPGAVAIDYLANNLGAIRHVVLRAVRGSGAIGLAMERRWPGPLLVSDLRIEGFLVGVSIKHPEYSVTVEHTILTHQVQIGLRNSGNMVAMRDVRIETAGIGIVNDNAQGFIVADALRFIPLGKDATFVRNAGYLTIRGPALKVQRRGASSFEKGGAFFENSRLLHFGADWRLAPVAASFPPAPPIDEWVSVTAFGAQPDSQQDSSSAIQAAMDSGASAIYFPTGTYTIEQPLTVPRSVRRIVGMMSVLTIGTRGSSFSRERGMLRVTTGGDPLVVERLALDNTERGSQVGFDHVGARSVWLRDYIGAGVSTHRRSTGGTLILENTLGPLNVSGPNAVSASQLNIEGQGVLIKNSGTPLSILGLKVEQNATVVENRAKGRTEIIGGLLYMVFPPTTPKPAMINYEGGHIFAAYAESAYRPAAVYTDHMVQVESCQTRTVVRADDLPVRGMARISPGRTLQPTPKRANAEAKCK
jgi:hypothetical protein